MALVPFVRGAIERHRKDDPERPTPVDQADRSCRNRPKREEMRKLVATHKARTCNFTLAGGEKDTDEDAEGVEPSIRRNSESCHPCI